MFTTAFIQMHKYSTGKALKKSIISNADRSLFIPLTFHINDTLQLLDWHHAFEFRFEGSMFDIVERHYSGDSVQYICWWDHEETALYKQWQAWAMQMSVDASRTAGSMLQLQIFFKGLYLNHSGFHRALKILSLSIKVHSSVVELVTQCWISPPESPPRTMFFYDV